MLFLGWVAGVTWPRPWRSEPITAVASQCVFPILGESIGDDARPFRTVAGRDHALSPSRTQLNRSDALPPLSADSVARRPLLVIGGRAVAGSLGSPDAGPLRSGRPDVAAGNRTTGSEMLRARRFYVEKGVECCVGSHLLHERSPGFLYILSRIAQ